MKQGAERGGTLTTTSDPGPVFLNYEQETPVTKDTFLFHLRGLLGRFGGHPLLVFCLLTPSVWVGGVSSNTAGHLTYGFSSLPISSKTKWSSNVT